LARPGESLIERIAAYREVYLIIALALALRIGLWFLVPYQGFVIDEKEYFGAAAVLADGRGFSFFDTATWLRPPLYIVFLATFIRAFGTNLVVIRLVQTLISVATVLLVYVLAKDIGGRRAALIAGLIAALFLPLAILPYLILSETLFIFLFLAGFVLMVKARRLVRGAEKASKRRLLTYLAAGGALLGLAALTRSIALTFLPFVLVWFLIMWPRKGSALLQFALVAGVCLVVIAPWTARNYVTYHRFLPIDNTSGYDFWLGTTGLRGQTEVEGTFLEIPNQADRQMVGLQRGLENVLRDPAAFLSKGGREFLDLWRINFGADERFVGGYTHGNVSPLYLGLVLVLEDTLYIVVGILAVIGFVRAWRHPATLLTLLWVVYLSAMAFVFFAVTRFRLPLLPFLAIFAGCAVAPWPERRHVLGRARMVAPAVVGLAFLAIVLPTYPLGETILGVQRWFEQSHVASGDDLLKQGQVAGAVAEYLQANLSLPETHVALAEAYKRENEPAQALKELDQAGEAYYGTHIVRGDLYRSQGQTDLARGELTSREVGLANPTVWAWNHLSPRPEETVDVGDLDLGYIDDFEGSEREGESTYRWTTGSSLIRLAAPSAGRAATLEIRLRGWRPEGSRPADVSIWVGGRELDHFQASPDWQTRSIELGSNLDKASPLVVEIRSSTFVPGGSDPRSLGVMVDWARVVSG
jgi:4-amino-4-deoxy-L-arabinose transferase-like glycosyltransferase